VKPFLLFPARSKPITRMPLATFLAQVQAA
jgi:hypothetical protein